MEFENSAEICIHIYQKKIIISLPRGRKGWGGGVLYSIYTVVIILFNFFFFFFFISQSVGAERQRRRGKKKIDENSNAERASAKLVKDAEE